MVTFFSAYEYSEPRDFWLRSALTGEILKLNTLYCSLAHLKHRVLSWTRIIDVLSLDLPEGMRMKMITLTYAGKGNWRPNHIREFVKSMRAFIGDALVGYAWCCEMQSRGEPHYHVLVVMSDSIYLPCPDKAGWWVHGHSDIRNSDGNPFYLYEYAKKVEQKASPFPKGARKYAVVVCRDYLSERDRWLLHMSAIPKWLADRAMEIEKRNGRRLHFKRSYGGGWLCKELCIVISSEWRFLGLSEPVLSDTPYGIQKDEFCIPPTVCYPINLSF